MGAEETLKTVEKLLTLFVDNSVKNYIFTASENAALNKMLINFTGDAICKIVIHCQLQMDRCV